MPVRLPKTRGMLRREAARWLARLQSDRGPEIERKFERWRDRDPRHAAVFDRVYRSYERAGLLRQSPHATIERGEPPMQRRGRPPRYAIAAVIAAVVLVPASVLVGGATGWLLGTHELMLATTVGQIREVKLSDGSTVTLDTLSSVAIEIGRSGRHARLNRGRARFEIADAPHPFVVEAADTTVTARQGVVDVERAGGQSRVDVLAGTAAVQRSRGAPAELTLSAGQALASTSRVPMAAHRLSAGPDWTRGMLQFDGTPLPAAVALANRYSDRHITIDGDLGTLRLTGAFRAGDTGDFANAVAATFGLSLTHTPDGSLRLHRRQRAAEENKNGG